MNTINNMKNILIIDDDSIYRLMHKRMLELSGEPMQIFTATNGLDALLFIQAYWAEWKILPDVILLDLMMPGMDGFEFVARFREFKIDGIENVHVVILSSSADPRDVSRSNALGVSTYLVKPVSMENLRETISEQL